MDTTKTYRIEDLEDNPGSNGSTEQDWQLQRFMQYLEFGIAAMTME